MALSVLEYTQTCLAAMESDAVDTLADTTEALDIANLLKVVYYELLAREDWPFLHRPISLTALGDVSKPTHFSVPANVKLVETLSYNISETGSYRRQELRWKDPLCFERDMQSGETATNVQLVEVGNSVKVWLPNDRWPTHYTSWDDVTVVLDSFHSDYESTATTARIAAHGVALPDFTVEDTFTPLIPLNMEPLLQAELNRTAFRYFKQIESVSDEQKATRQLARGRREASRLTRESDNYYRNSFGRHAPSMRQNNRPSRDR